MVSCFLAKRTDEHVVVPWGYCRLASRDIRLVRVFGHLFFFFFCRHLVICTDVVILQRFDIFSGIIITTITITITTILVCLRFFLCLVSCSRHIPPTSTIPMHCQYFHQHVWLGLRGSFRKDRCSLWLFLPDTCLCLLLQQKCASVAPVNPHLFRIIGYTTICQ